MSEYRSTKGGASPGDLAAYGGNHSAADLALCNILTFWTRDRDQIDRIFRGSVLLRPKWDERRAMIGSAKETARAIYREAELERDDARRPALATNHECHLETDPALAVHRRDHRRSEDPEL